MDNGSGNTACKERGCKGFHCGGDARGRAVADAGHDRNSNDDDHDGIDIVIIGDEADEVGENGGSHCDLCKAHKRAEVKHGAGGVGNAGVERLGNIGYILPEQHHGQHGADKEGNFNCERKNVEAYKNGKQGDEGQPCGRALLTFKNGLFEHFVVLECLTGGNRLFNGLGGVQEYEHKAYRAGNEAEERACHGVGTKVLGRDDVVVLGGAGEDICKRAAHDEHGNEFCVPIVLTAERRADGNGQKYEDEGVNAEVAEADGDDHDAQDADKGLCLGVFGFDMRGEEAHKAVRGAGCIIQCADDRAKNEDSAENAYHLAEARHVYAGKGFDKIHSARECNEQ